MEKHNQVTPYEKVKLIRATNRLNSRDFINGIFEHTIEMHGDRFFSDDAAIIAGIGMLEECPISYIAIERGNSIELLQKTHFGCPKPEGYRKSLRIIKQAEKFRRPVICFVNTLGAFCGAEGEERGQGRAIAENMMELLGVEVPTISIILGEGGSGGALALCVTDCVFMLENAVYSVITPEGCASILWQDSKRADEAANYMKITANDMLQLGVIDGIIEENFCDFSEMCKDIKQILYAQIQKLKKKGKEQVLQERYRKFRQFGIYEEKISL